MTPIEAIKKDLNKMLGEWHQKEYDNDYTATKETNLARDIIMKVFEIIEKYE